MLRKNVKRGLRRGPELRVRTPRQRLEWSDEAPSLWVCNHHDIGSNDEMVGLRGSLPRQRPRVYGRVTTTTLARMMRWWACGDLSRARGPELMGV